MLDKELEEAEMLGMIPNIQNLKGTKMRRDEHYYTTVLQVYYNIHYS